MVPSSVLFFKGLAKTELGKIKTEVLRQEVLRRRAAVVETDLISELRSASLAGRRSLLREEIGKHLRRILHREPPVSPGSELDVSATFGQLGLDSLGALELANSLSVAVGRPLSATLTFDHPTIDAVCDELLKELFPSTDAVATVKSAGRSAQREPVAIVGIGCRLPGKEGTLADPEAFWRSLRDGVASTRVVPSERWNVEQFYDAVRGTPGKTYTRCGSFIDSVNLLTLTSSALPLRRQRGSIRNTGSCSKSRGRRWSIPVTTHTVSAADRPECLWVSQVPPIQAPTSSA